MQRSFGKICAAGARAVGLDARPLGFGATGLTVVLFLSFVLFGCSGSETGNGDERKTDIGSFPVQETRVKKWVEYRLGKMAWEFRGDVVRYFEEPERVEADGVIVDFYDETEVYHSTLLADFGSIDRKSSDMEVRDSVVITNRNGTRVETEWACWDNEAEKIYTDAFVTITKERQVITGYGLETDPGLEDARILSDVVVHTIEETDE